MPATELVELERAANRLSGTVRRRLSETYGTEVAEAADRLAEVRRKSGVGPRGDRSRPRSGREPLPLRHGWEELAGASCSMDTGARTRRRTVAPRSIRLHPQRQSDGGHRGTESRVREHSAISLRIVLLEQTRSRPRRLPTTLRLRTDGVAKRREGRRLGSERSSGPRSNQLSTNERETLEAAREVGHWRSARIHRSHADGHARRSVAPNALEQAEMVSPRALKSVGPDGAHRGRMARGGGLPRIPADAGVTSHGSSTVAEALHGGDSRSIANRIIAGMGRGGSGIRRETVGIRERALFDR